MDENIAIPVPESLTQPFQPQLQPPTILSPLGQQRYAMMQEINQTALTLSANRVASESSLLCLRRIADALARQIAEELEG